MVFFLVDNEGCTTVLCVAAGATRVALLRVNHLVSNVLNRKSRVKQSSATTNVTCCNNHFFIVPYISIGELETLFWKD